MVEYLVGDGPNNRYALICHDCHSHNGMALRDEFEYTSFRCAYCFQLNPARKKKPSLATASLKQSKPEITPQTAASATVTQQGSEPAAETDGTAQVQLIHSPDSLLIKVLVFLLATYSICAQILLATY
jgi:hypothetical protein